MYLKALDTHLSSGMCYRSDLGACARRSREIGQQEREKPFVLAMLDAAWSIRHARFETQLQHAETNASRLETTTSSWPRRRDGRPADDTVVSARCRLGVRVRAIRVV